MTFPRTTASALLSPASRSPSRLWNASSTASFTSFVSAGSAVWLSKGRMATVLMLGRPPPAKPYRHPLSATASALTAPAPNRRIEHRGRIDRHHRKLKTGPLLGKIHAGARRPPLRIEFSAAARQHSALSPPLRLEHRRTAPRVAVVERVAVLHEPPDSDGRVAPPVPKHHGVGCGRPHAPAFLVVLIRPPEPDRGVAQRQRGPTPADGGVPIRRGQWLRDQRRGRARAAGQERTGGNVGECYPRVKRKMLRSQELNLKRGGDDDDG